MELVKFILCFCAFPIVFAGYHYPDAVELEKVKVLTLYHGKMTNGRRTSPVPQLKCVGGSAAKSFTPQVVQCYNMGSDGQDVQWECKTDMDNAYRFGHISVSCEGYSYPDDPYVLKGSCGLEYTLDLTKEGYEKQQGREHNYYGNSYDNDKGTSYKSKELYAGSVIFLIGMCLVIYTLYKTCIAPSTEQQFQSSSTNDDHSYPSDRSFPNAPPPPGFHPSFTSQGGASCHSQPTNSGGSNTGGFWTGAATGGLLGYMFGSQSNNSRAYNRRRSDYSYAFGGPSTQSRRTSSPDTSSSTGTRTASGFGGTTRR